MIRSFFDPGLWLLGYDYLALNDAPNRWNYHSLTAPFWRVYWHNTAGAALRLNRQIIPIRPDHLYIIPSNVDFASLHHGHCRQLYIHFQLRHPHALRGPPIIILPLTRTRRHFVRRIIAGHGKSKTDLRQTALLIRALLETLIADLINRRLLFRNVDKRLLMILSYLEQHLAQRIDNKKMAALMHTHPQTILRLFQNEFGKSPQVYLRQLRVDKACWFLRFSEDSIKAIAEETGFCDRYHFTKVFTALMGQSPARFRDYNKARGQ